MNPQRFGVRDAEAKGHRKLMVPFSFLLAFLIVNSRGMRRLLSRDAVYGDGEI